MKIHKGAILPLGFAANAAAAGIKKSGRLDLALLYSYLPAKSACLFTANKIQAAHIWVDKKHLRQNKYFQAVIINSGNANCFTGKPGLRDAEEAAGGVAGLLGIRKESVLVASTGIIARKLPVHKLKQALPGLVRGLSRKGIDKAKIAIMTTDTVAKEITVKFNIGGRIITICGIAKGAGMIAPNLATMLAFIFTDAKITQKALNKSMKISVGNSFNCITVDGCMSTNDSVIILANGAANNALVDADKNFNLFSRALNTICLELAKLIVKDAEGATKFIKIRVDNAKTAEEAKKVALGIANSDLFKTAMYGENPNFGRIVAAAGASGVDIKEENLKIKVSSLSKKDIDVYVSVERGNSGITVYTSDLTPEYIKINAEYN